MMSLKEYQDPHQACLADYIPWALIVAPGVIEHKDGSWQKSFLFRGSDLDSATARDLMATAAQFNNAMRRLGEGWSIFVEAQRNTSSEYPVSTWPHCAAQIIDDERREEFSRPGRYFKNDYYLTLVFKRPERLSAKASWFIKKAHNNQPSNDNLDSFLRKVQELQGLLIGLFSVFRELNDDETLTYLHSTVSTNRFASSVGDVGHSLVFGPTGSGKSTLLSFMAAQWLRYPEAQVFIFDKGASSRVLTECMGGSFFSVGAKNGDLCFQPLRDIDLEPERIWASEWLGEILEGQGCALSSDIRLELWQALLGLAEQEPNSRTLSVFRSLVQNEKIREALQPFTISGPYGYLFDASEEAAHNNFWQVFETAELFEQKTAIKPALSYLFHRLGKRFDGKPTLLILDEAWLFLEESMFAKKIKQWLKELRKANVYVIFATQSLADAMQSSIAMALKESCPTKIFLPNPSAEDDSSAEFYRSLGLNQRQIGIIAHAIPKRDYYLSSPVGNRLFDLALGPKALALCASSTVNDQKLMRDIKTHHSKKIFLDMFLQIKGIKHENNNRY